MALVRNPKERLITRTSTEVAIKLTSPKTVLSILKKYDIRLDKAFGQHFLVDENIRNKIIQEANLTKDDVVLEVGPGIGTLSQEIAPRVRKLWLVELDKRFIPVLHETLSDKDNIDIIQDDALKVDYSKLKPKPTKIVSNLPYNIAAPLIMKLLNDVPSISDYTIMVQHEMANRLTAPRDSKDYSAITVKIAYFGEAKKLFKVSEQVFMPKPKVQSEIIKVERYNNKDKDERLFKIISETFKYRRKTLKNSLILAGFEKEQAEQALSEISAEKAQRPQNLDVNDFQKLAKVLDNLV